VADLIVADLSLRFPRSRRKSGWSDLVRHARRSGTRGGVPVRAARDPVCLEVACK
jgi:hypothetical protein